METSFVVSAAFWAPVVTESQNDMAVFLAIRVWTEMVASFYDDAASKEASGVVCFVSEREKIQHKQQRTRESLATSITRRTIVVFIIECNSFRWFSRRHPRSSSYRPRRRLSSFSRDVNRRFVALRFGLVRAARWRRTSGPRLSDRERRRLEGCPRNVQQNDVLHFRVLERRQIVPPLLVNAWRRLNRHPRCFRTFATEE